MTEPSVPDHVVVQCMAASCGLRFPVPVGDPRHGSCPLCEATTNDVEPVPPPHPPVAVAPIGGQTAGLLDNIRSALNVGTMFRTADGANLAHLHLCGLTPAGDHPKVRKTALGAEDSVPWSHAADSVACAEQLIAEGWTLWAFESTPGAVALDQVEGVPERVVAIVGNERAGVDPALLRMAETVISLPMGGAKSTLNVGVAFGVAAYGIRRLRVSQMAGEIR